MASWKLKRTAAAILAGAAIGAFLFWVFDNPTILKWIMLGAACGGVLGITWPIYKTLITRLHVDDWKLEEIEIQGLKFSTGGAQRRVAWRLFVEITTRISTQPMDENEGDDGVALASLYSLFQFTRKTVSEMEITQNATGETIETYALDMLNSDLRPFLSKWHPRWDVFAVGKKPSTEWPEHRDFREALQALQNKIEGRARGLAQIAGIKNTDRFFRKASK